MTQCMTRTGSYWWVQHDSMYDKDGELLVGKHDSMYDKDGELLVGTT